MPEPERLRDSTQIVFRCEDLTEVRERLETEFAVTVVATDEAVCRIVGSPVAFSPDTGSRSRGRVAPTGDRWKTTGRSVFYRRPQTGGYG
jgi:hypothetical protein